MACAENSKTRDTRAYSRMLYGLLLVIGIAFSFTLVWPKFGFNFCPLNSLGIDAFLLAPFAAALLLVFGPSSKLRTIGLFLAVPLALWGLAVLGLYEYVDGSLRVAANVLAHGGISEKMLRTYTESGSGTIVQQGKVGTDDLRVVRSSVGAFSGYDYDIKLSRPLGSYLFQRLEIVRVPPHRTPSLILRPDGGYDLKVNDSCDHEIFRADVLAVLNKQKQIPW